MPMKVRCDICADLLEEPGALAFSPPTSMGYTIKYHVCMKCWRGTLLQLLSSSLGAIKEISDAD